MRQIDDYVQSIVAPILTTKQVKEDLGSELSDHLNMLKEEFMQKGLGEDEAIRAAIEIFGNKRTIKNKLKEEIESYRSLPTFLTGAVFYSIAFLLFLTLQKNGPSGHAVYGLASWALLLLYLGPVGYFLPMIHKGFQKIGNVFLASLSGGVFIEILYIAANMKNNLITLGQLDPKVWFAFAFHLAAVAIVSSMDGVIGYIFLKTVNRAFIYYKDLRYQKARHL